MTTQDENDLNGMDSNAFKIRLAKIIVKGATALTLVFVMAYLLKDGSASKELIALLGPLVGAAINGIYRDLRDK